MRSAEKKETQTGWAVNMGLEEREPGFLRPFVSSLPTTLPTETPVVGFHKLVVQGLDALHPLATRHLGGIRGLETRVQDKGAERQ